MLSKVICSEKIENINAELKSHEELGFHPISMSNSDKTICVLLEMK